MNKMLFKPKRNEVNQRTSLTGYASVKAKTRTFPSNEAERTSLTGYASIKAKTRTLPSNEAERMSQTLAAWLLSISRFVQEQQFTAD